MPGKVNPTQAEALVMAATQVLGNDVTMGIAGAGGQLELSTYKPLLIATFLQSARLLSDGCERFRVYAVEGLEADRSTNRGVDEPVADARDRADASHRL